MKQIQITIRDKRWTLKFCRLKKDLGRCDRPTNKDKRILINQAIVHDSVKFMDTMLHELLHASNWDLDEEFVYEYARDAALILHKLGFGLLGDEAPPNRTEP